MKTTFRSLRAVALLLALMTLIALSMTLQVSAAENDPSAPRLCDNAGLLSTEQVHDLTTKIYELKAQYDTDFIIVTVDSLDGKTPAAFAGEFYDKNQYGHNASRDGILMLVAMGSRDYYFLTNGAVTGKITDGYGISTLENKVVSSLSGGDYYTAFDTYLDTAASLIATAEGDPYVVQSGRTDEFVYIGFDDIPSAADRWRRIGLFAVIGIIAGFITTAVMKHGMKTARAQKFAMDYVRPGSFHLTRKQDIFLYHTRTRVRVQSNNASHGGGGGHRGGSRGGGGGKF